MPSLSGKVTHWPQHFGGMSDAQPQPKGGPRIMKLLLIVTVYVLLSMGMAGVGLAQNAPQGAAEQVVKGDVLLKEGDEIIIKDISGHEIRVHVSPETKKDGVIKIGDKIEATVTREGHAISIRQQIPQ
jgi:hypothetical protein